MTQLTFTQDPTIAYAGLRADNGFADIISGLASSRKLVSVAVTADDSQLYTVTINGTDFEFTSDASATTAEITAGLVAAIEGGSEPVTAVGTDTPFTIESTIDGDAGDFTSAYAAGGTGDLVETVVIEQGQLLPFGKYVSRDTNHPEDKAVRLPRVATDITTTTNNMGVVMEDRAREDNAEQFRANTMVPVLRRGRIYVQVEQAVAKGGAVFVRYAAGGNGAGSFGADSGTSERETLPNAVYMSSAAVDGFAIVDIG